MGLLFVVAYISNFTGSVLKRARDKIEARKVHIEEVPFDLRHAIEHCAKVGSSVTPEFVLKNLKALVAMAEKWTWED